MVWYKFNSGNVQAYRTRRIQHFYFNQREKLPRTFEKRLEVDLAFVDEEDVSFFEGDSTLTAGPEDWIIEIDYDQFIVVPDGIFQKMFTECTSEDFKDA